MCCRPKQINKQIGRIGLKLSSNYIYTGTNYFGRPKLISLVDLKKINEFGRLLTPEMGEN